MENSKFKMGTVTIRKAGSKLNAKICEVFHRYDDGRVNAQFQKEDGSVINLTLQTEEFVNNEEYLSKLDESVTAALLSEGKQINGVTLKFASEKDRRKGESYGVFHTSTNKIIAGGLTRENAMELAATNDSYHNASAEWMADHLKEAVLESSSKKPLNTWIADLKKLTKVQNEKNQKAAIIMVTTALKEYPDSDELQRIEGDVYDWGM